MKIIKNNKQGNEIKRLRNTILKQTEIIKRNNDIIEKMQEKCDAYDRLAVEYAVLTDELNLCIKELSDKRDELDLLIREAKNINKNP